MKAIWNGQVIAESDDTVIVEGNHYFPGDAICKEYFSDCDHKTVCGWKGEASYYDVAVEGEINKASAWCYPDPKSEAAHIAGRIAFWRGVEVVE
ncbi:MAG: hypothetical protein CBC48_08310 [bacterium TMED88]|nr:hypothetical protein [Deltaproteobacteria bacterium]OUV32411.1 MAG: hypothetical protein CBC48_08310 [bacterium TMED88]